MASTVDARSGTTWTENDRTIIRYGAWFGLIGAVLAFVGNALHPRTFEGATRAAAELARYELIADSGIWKPIHFLIGVALIFLIGALVAFDRRLNGRPGGAWARLGLIVGIVSTAVAVPLIALDGWTMKTLANDWAAAGRASSGLEFTALNTTEQVVNGIFSAFIGTLIGVTPVLLGIALYQSRIFARWMGLLAIAGGALGIAVDAIQSVGEVEGVTANVLFPLAALALTIVLLVGSWKMIRETTGHPQRVAERATVP